MEQHHLHACPSHTSGIPSDCSCDKEVRHYVSLAKPVVLVAAVLLIGGLLTKSSSLISEGLHQLADSAESITNAFVSYFARRGDETSARKTGIRIGATLLLGAGLWIISEGFERTQSPHPVHGYMVFFALFGLIFTLFLRKKHHGAAREHHNENHILQDYHLMTDITINASVLIGGSIMWLKGGWYAIDGYLAVIIGIIVSTIAIGKLFGIKFLSHQHSHGGDCDHNH